MDNMLDNAVQEYTRETKQLDYYRGLFSAFAYIVNRALNKGEALNDLDMGNFIEDLHGRGGVNLEMITEIGAHNVLKEVRAVIRNTNPRKRKQGYQFSCVSRALKAADIDKPEIEQIFDALFKDYIDACEQELPLSERYIARYKREADEEECLQQDMAVMDDKKATNPEQSEYDYESESEIEEELAKSGLCEEESDMIIFAELMGQCSYWLHREWNHMLAYDLLLPKGEKELDKQRDISFLEALSRKHPEQTKTLTS